MATTIKSKRGLINMFDTCSQEVQDYFEHVPSLLDDYPMHVCLAYVFSRLELGQNMALYCGVVKRHKVNTVIANSAVGAQHLTRDGFVGLYKTVFDCELPTDAHADLKVAEKTRDKVMHGKKADDNTIRNAIARVLEFAEEVNTQLDKQCKLKPFVGSLQGFSGASKKLDKRTSRFILKGMGFGIA
jgi:hypothetical protein